MAKDQDGSGPIIIKKYANRRLYNTSSSSYITLDDLARMTRQGTDFQVLDAKTGDDITHSILTQIIMEEEASGQQMLPVSFLRQLIGMYGNSMQTMMPSYLEATMANFREHQVKLKEAFEGNVTENPFAKMAEANLAMFRSAAQAMMAKVGAEPAAKPTEPETAPDSELELLRKQLAAMQKRLDELDK
ncbi:MAG: polyhydroxyalkanoate synthesis repressor PhaR [Sphingomonadaceae bacterium]|nr:polyhydroxyalkanoate synthesis repressor PhaR [Sphingomonadaceae bacterium]